MQSELENMIQTQSDAHLASLGRRILNWLVADLNQPAEGSESAPAFTSSRVRALLRAADVLDEPTWHDFKRLTNEPAGMRLALYDLLSSSGLDRDEEVTGMAQVNAGASASESSERLDWLPLAVAAFAWKRQYPLYQLDPASPPEPHSPAGQILTRTAHFIRRQVQRSATDRDKLTRKLAYDPAAGSAGLDQLQADAPIAPVPPHYRTPVPVNYPEYAHETVQVTPTELSEPAATPARGEPITITEEDLAESGHSSAPATMPEIRISREQLEPEPQRPISPLPPTAVIMPTPSRGASSRSGLTMSLRNMFRTEELNSTKLRVIVQEHPDGPGLYGLQVKVTCRGIRSFVAGTTDRNGSFVAELPVRMTEGLTYDVDVTWPREVGGETERKSITLNADRTEFKLPFYQRLLPAGE